MRRRFGFALFFCFTAVQAGETPLALEEAARHADRLRQNLSEDTNARGWFQLATLEWHAGRPHAARKALQTAWRLEPGDPDIRRLLAGLLLDPRDALFWRIRVQSLHAAGREEDRLRAADAARRLGAADPEMIGWLAHWLLDAERWTEGMERYREIRRGGVWWTSGRDR